ncbi:MAG: hypothetical protein NXI30_02795 [bacterium]|nr:hypothetical protein [bacterium]
MGPKKPWERHFSLTEERLRIVAEILRDVRNDALEDFSAERGDRAWGHGCRVYERSCEQLNRASEKFDWLDIHDSSLHFIFKIGGVPVRFYRGDPDNPNRNLLRICPGELEQQQQAFAFLDDNESGWFWRIAVATDADERVLEIFMLEVRDSGETRNAWSIPLNGDVRVLHDVSATPQPVKLAPPVVEVRTADRKEEDGDGPSGGR